MIAKERVSGRAFIPVWVKNEHLARYAFAAGYAKDKVVVDCASGDGTGSMTFAKAGAKRVEAFDVEKEAVDAAAEKWRAESLRFRVSSGLSLPLPAGFADLYISLETIEHVEEDVAFLKEVVRVLKDDGMFICSTPNRDVSNPGKKLTDKPWNPFHVREYSHREFIALLSRAFGEIEVFGQNPQLAPKVALMTTLGKVLPFHGAVRINQAIKLSTMMFDSYEKHRVSDGAEIFEYVVAVCRKPKTF